MPRPEYSKPMATELGRRAQSKMPRAISDATVKRRIAPTKNGVPHLSISYGFDSDSPASLIAGKGYS